MKKLFPTVAVFAIAILGNGESFAVTGSVPMATNVSDSAIGDAEIQHKEALREPLRSNCIKQTGSHIVVKDGRVCNGQMGNAYTEEDIDRTGAITTADALQHLDTAVQIRR